MQLARKRIRRYLSKDPEIEIIGECDNGQQAIEVFTNLKPQLVFLDVQMPETDGFQFIEAIDANDLPTIIFVTAFDQFAIQAFEVNAFDYLLKPFSLERLETTLNRAKATILKQDNALMDERLLTLLNELKGGEKYLRRITVKDGGKITFVETDELEFIEAQGNYLELNIGKRSHLIRMRLHQLEAKLDGQKFVRIHRSTIVNIDRIKEMQPLFNGDQSVIMKSGKKLKMTRNHRDNLMNILENT